MKLSIICEVDLSRRKFLQGLASAATIPNHVAKSLVSTTMSGASASTFFDFDRFWNPLWGYLTGYEPGYDFSGEFVKEEGKVVHYHDGEKEPIKVQDFMNSLIADAYTDSDGQAIVYACQSLNFGSGRNNDNNIKSLLNNEIKKILGRNNISDLSVQIMKYLSISMKVMILLIIGLMGYVL